MRNCLLAVAASLLCITLFPGSLRAQTPDLPLEPAWEGSRGLFLGTALSASAARLEAAGKFKAAAKVYGRMYETAKADVNKAYALARKARCLYAARKYFQAQKAYKELLETYPAYIRLEETLVTQRQMAGKFASGAASALHFRNNELAIEVYETILKVAPAGRNAPGDMLTLGDLQAAADQGDAAILTWRDLAKRFPLTSQAADARLRVARLLLTESRMGDGDGRIIRQARNEVDRFLRDFPNHPQVGDAKLMLSMISERQAERLLSLAKFYLRRYSYRPAAALRYLSDLGRTYPDTAAAVMAKLLIARTDFTVPAARPGVAMQPGTKIPGTIPAGAPVPAVASGSGATPAEALEPELLPAPGSKPVEVQPPPPPVKHLEQQEKVQKWLLPLEDFNEFRKKSK